MADDDEIDSFGGYLNDRYDGQAPMQQDAPPDAPALNRATTSGRHFPSIATGEDYFKWTAAMNNTVCPQRVMCINIKAAYLQPDAVMLSHALTPEQKNALAHANGVFSMATMLFAGTGKGLPTGTPPKIAQMHLDGSDPDEIAKEIKSMVPFQYYTYTPQHVDQGVLHTSDEHVRQFALGLEYIRNKSKTGYWGVRVWKVVMDPTHSDSALWSPVMQENQNAYNQTTNHAMPDKLRKTTEATFATSSRQMSDKNNLEESVLNAFRWVRTNQDLCTLYELYSGGGSAPLFENMQSEIGNDEMNRPLMPHETLGGTHKLGPEWALNVRRKFPLVAGMTASHDDTDRPCEEQCTVDNYVGPNNELRFPTEACDLGEVFFTSNASVRCLMTKPLPIQLTSVAKPSDAVLEFWFAQKWQTDPELLDVVDARSVHANGVAAEWRKYEDVCQRGFLKHISGHGYATSIDKLMQNTELRSNASINLSAKEKAVMTGVSRGDAGSRPREALVEVGKKVSRAFGLVRTYGAEITEKLQALKKEGYAQNKARIDELQEAKNRQTATLVRDINLFGLALQSRVFLSKQERRDIAPGMCKAHDSLLKDMAAFAAQLTTGIYRMDPADPRSSLGTANIAFGMGNDQYSDVAVELAPEARKAPWAAFRQFVVHLLSKVLLIEGRESRVGIEVYQQQYETFAKFSTVLNMCGARGCAKSELLNRMEKIFPEGTFQNAGSRSQKEGLNRDYNPYAATMRIFQEVPAMFYDKGEEEISKQAVWDNFTNHSRNTKKVQSDGTEDWATTPMYQIREETYGVANNCGPMMITREEEEPDPSKQALYDRFHVQVCFSTRPPGEESYANSKEFQDSLVAPSNARAIAAFKVMVGLIKKTLSYTTKVPEMQTKTEHANLLFRQWDRMLVHQFGIARPESRRETKRHWTLQLICAEAACAEVFFCKQSASNFDFMMPALVVDPDEETPENGIRGHLAVWDESQLEPAIRRSAMPTIHDCLAAWSAALDYAEQTSAHFFWVLHNVAESVGIKADLRDFCTMSNQSPPRHTTPSGADGPGGASLDPQDANMASDQPEAEWPADRERGVRFPHFMHREGGVCVEDARRRVAEMEKQRIARVASLRVGLRVGSQDGDTAMMSIRRSWQQARDDEMPSFFDTKLGRVRAMTLDEASGYVYPNPMDLLAVGYGEDQLAHWSRGVAVVPLQVDHTFGTVVGNYTFQNWQPANKAPTAAAIDPGWRLMQTTPPDQNKRWMSATRAVLEQAAINGSHSATTFGLTTMIVRDCLYLASCWEVPVRAPRNNELRFKYESAMTKIEATESASVVAGQPTLHTPVPATQLVRPADSEVFRADSARKESTFGRLADYRAFRRWIPPLLDSAGKPLDEAEQDRGVFGARLEALVDRGRLPAMAPLYSTRVEKSRPIRMGNDNTLLVNTDFFVRHQALFVEVALDNLRHPGMRRNFYGLQLNSRGPVRASGALSREMSPGSEQAAVLRAEGKIPGELTTTASIDTVPLHYDMLQLFLTNKALEMVSMDVADTLELMGMANSSKAIPRFATRFRDTSDESTMITIPYKAKGTAAPPSDESLETCPDEVRRALENAEALHVRTLKPDDPEVLEQIKRNRKKDALPVEGDQMHFSTWISNAFVIGQDTGLFANSDDPVWLSIMEATLGVTSHRIEQNLISPAWQRIFAIGGRCSGAPDVESISRARATNAEHAKDRGKGAIPSSTGLRELPRKRPRE